MSDQAPQKLFGYHADVEATQRFNASLPLRSFSETPAYGNDNAPDEIYLWTALLVLHTAWKRYAQGIGDCVSWGWELCCTMMLAIMARAGRAEWITTAATESIYGGARVEADGGRLGGFMDGAFGGGAAKFLSRWGCLLRLDYSKETGIAEHNLTEYSADKAKSWGNYGCGGKDDAGRDDGKLDKIAKRFPVSVVPVRTVDEAWSAIGNGYPIAVCSNVGFDNGRNRNVRNADGVIAAAGRWSHCMMFAGRRKLNGRRQFRCFQSWGFSTEGPDPGIQEEAVSRCSWWVDERDAERMLAGQDSYAVSFVDGFPPQAFNLSDAVSTWG